MVDITTTAGFRLFITLEVESSQVANEKTDEISNAVNNAKGDIRRIEIVGSTINLQLDANSTTHQAEIIDALRSINEVEIDAVVDAVEAIHDGGKIDVIPRLEIKDEDDLAMAYTPGVGRISSMIADDVNRVWDFTGRHNAVAVLSNGTAVLGLGDIGPEAAMPVMEGKAILFREFGGIAAYPICVNARTADELVSIAKALEPTFGGINLEDIAAPICFEAERRMREELSIPVFHDDQHGTAVVTLAAMINACKVVNKDFSSLRVVTLGAGAAGVACAKLLLSAGVKDVIPCDRKGAIYKSREGLTDEKMWLAEHANHTQFSGSLAEAFEDADAFMGLSGPNLVEPEWLERMSNDAIVFAMANPVPEIMPELIPSNVSVIATGRSDYPNQINNVLVFPGFFRGLLDARATKVTDEMKLSAAYALAGILHDEELSAENIIPSAFNGNVSRVVAQAVQEIAERE